MKRLSPLKNDAGKTSVTVQSVEGMNSTTDNKQSSRIAGGSLHSKALGESVEKGMHRIRATIVMVLVWLGNYRLRLEKGKGKLPRASEVYLGLEQEVRARDAELADVACQLMLPIQSAKWRTRSECFKREAATWDELAIGNFYGRLLPGCSYLGCRNMSGTSETALQTLLCSGCKHSKYSSVSFQRDAWVMGGHLDVCGKGNWCDRTTTDVR